MQTGLNRRMSRRLAPLGARVCQAVGPGLVECLDTMGRANLQVGRGEAPNLWVGVLNASLVEPDNAYVGRFRGAASSTERT